MTLRYLFILFCFASGMTTFAQPVRIAILDFENISGIEKYNGLGKAMSSMLISDIELNVSSKRLQLVERAQIQKILKEQKFQASGSVNKSTAVQAGKILGVKYLLVGDVFVLNDQLIINARLTNAETGDIVFAKKQEGKMGNWLSLKTTIAKDLATNFSLPFTEPRINDVTVAPAVLTTYANAIDEKDKGNFETAEKLINTAKDFNPDFSYLDDLKDDVDKLKKQVAEQGKKIEALEKSDTVQNKKISTLETSDVKQTGQINTLEKSGGRIIGAATFQENLLNLYSTLTPVTEKEKIVVYLINTFPNEFESGFGMMQHGMFHLEYIAKYGQLSENLNFDILNSIISPLLPVLDTTRHPSTYSNYLFTKLFLLIRYNSVSKISQNKTVDLNSYKKFVSNFTTIVNKITPNEQERNYYKFIFYNDYYALGNLNISIHPVIKEDILNNFKVILGTLNFKYTSQVLDIARKYNNSQGLNLYSFGNNYFVATYKLILALSRSNTALKNVYEKIITHLSLFQQDLKEIVSLSQTNNDDIYASLEEVCAEYFLIPSIFNEGKFRYNSSYVNEYFAGDAILQPINPTYQKQILSLDSVNRRYTWIYEYTDTMEFASPCDFVKLNNELIRKSDSAAFQSKLYLLSDNFAVGTKVEVVFNNKSDTLGGIIVGKTVDKKPNAITVVETSLSKKINKSNTILIKLVDKSDPYLTKREEIDYKSIYDDYFKECEELEKKNKNQRL